ncbi:MAG: phosphodiester glycosidase family protein [Ruminococcus sp.]|nr:phosphodiester glycosidase family protein [Ruminococcus sp.]
MAEKRKMLPVWGVVLLDIALTAAGIGGYMLFDYVMPQKLSVKTEVVATVDSSADTFALPDEKTDSQGEQTDESETESAVSDHDLGVDSKASNRGTVEPKSQNGKRNLSNKNTYDVESDKNLFSSINGEEAESELLGTTRTDNSVVSVYKRSIGEGDEKITYFVADVYVSNVSEIKTAFADDSYGKNIKDSVYNMAVDNNAIFAINGDYYGNAEESIVIRNGVKYRDSASETDVLVLFTDGVMRTYLPEEFDIDAVIAQGAWQAWNFGPALLDGEGNVLDTFNTTSYLNSKNPRSAVGYVEPGHYVFVTVDGRDKGYSSGATLSELAAILSDEGCIYGYNLDGGKSAMMYYDGEIINEPDGGGRDISDIIYVSKQED